MGFDATPRFQLASAIFRDGPDDGDYGGFGLSLGRHDGYLVAGPVWKIAESGCYFCFFQRKVEWTGLKERHPELFESAKQYEKMVPTEGLRGFHLVRG